MQPQQPYGPPPQNPEPPREYPPLQPHQPGEYVPYAGQPQQPVQPNQGQPVQNIQPLPTYPSIAPTNANPNDYEFIVNPAKPSTKVSLLGGSGSKLPLFIIGGLLVLLLGFGGFALLSGNKDQNVQTYLSLSQQQTELLRLSAVAISQTSASTTVKNSALTTNMTLTTDAAKFASLLSRGGIAFKSDQLALGQDAAATKKLETAISTNTFDTVYNEIMQTKITRYQQTLQTTYGAVTADTTKQLLSDSYEHAKLLDKQIGEN